MKMHGETQSNERDDDEEKNKMTSAQSGPPRGKDSKQTSYI